jgi:hypothetical protein
MACTRFNYDPCRTKKNLQQATGPGRWILDVPGNGDSPCFFEDPHILLQKWGANLRTNSINLESELIGNNKRPYSRDCYFSQRKKTTVIDAPPLFSVSTDPILFPNNSTVMTEESRVTHPAWWYRDVEQKNWWQLPLNPQTNVCLPFHSNLNTRILEKDYFTPKRECFLEENTTYGLPTANYEDLIKPTMYPILPQKLP